MAKYVETEQNSHNTITSGTEIIGDINSTGDIRLDGFLKGNLKTKGKVVIGSTGKVTGTITCKNSDIFGLVEGQIYVTDLLSLKSTANIKGDIIFNKLAVEPGCKLSGNMFHGYKQYKWRTNIYRKSARRHKDKLMLM